MTDTQILRALTEQSVALTDAVTSKLVLPQVRKDLGLTDESVQLLSSAIKGWMQDTSSKHIQYVQKQLVNENALVHKADKKKLVLSTCF